MINPDSRRSLARPALSATKTQFLCRFGARTAMLSCAGILLVGGRAGHQEKAGPSAAPPVATPVSAEAAPPRPTDAQPTDLIVYRQKRMEEMFSAFTSTYDEMIKDTPDLAIVRKGTLTISKGAQDLSHWFPKGTGPEAGVPTRAKPEIWLDRANVAQAENRLRVEATKLNQLAIAGNLPAMVNQFGRTSDACSDCHTKYRAPAAKGH